MGPHTNNSATQSSSNWWRRFNENNAARRGEARNRSSRGVPEVLQRAGTVANKLSMRYQQGGTINNSTNSSDELYADFAIRLLSSLGLSENEILVNGELNPQYSEMVINSINEIDTPEFWNAYVQNPDQIVNEYINSKSPQENMDTETSSAVDENSDIEFARKGAALKQLRKNKKTLTCKCGCKMTSKREGGKLVTKCSCGCKS